MYKKSKILKAVRNELQSGNQLMVAQRKAGLKSPDTLHRWRSRPLINRYILRCIELSEDYRVAAVEDAQFKSAINGNTKAQEMFLLNRASDRWKKDKSIITVNNTTQVNQVLKARDELVEGMDNEQRQQFISRIREVIKKPNTPGAIGEAAG